MFSFGGGGGKAAIHMIGRPRKLNYLTADFEPNVLGPVFNPSPAPKLINRLAHPGNNYAHIPDELSAFEVVKKIFYY